MASSNTAKAVLVVTGAWHVPAHYRKLTDLLEERGIRAICPCLPTNNNARPPNKTIFDDIALIRDIATSETAKGTQLTVLAHSYGGYISSAALSELAYPINEDPAKGGVTNIIYMSSFPPMEGQTLAELCGGAFPPFVRPQDDGSLDVDDPAHFFYNDLPDDEVKEALDKLVLHQVAAHLTDVGCRKAAWRVIPTSYLICEGDTALLAPFQEAIIGKIKEEGVEMRVFRCAGGHAAFLSVPGKVAEVVLEVVGSC